MKTIKERANGYAQRYMNASDGNLYKIAEAAGMKIGYIQGATDQQNIDTKKACEWLKANTYTFRSDEFLEPLVEAMKGE